MNSARCIRAETPRLTQTIRKTLRDKHQFPRNVTESDVKVE